MKHSLFAGKEPNLQKIVVASAILHLMFISLAVVPFKSREREFRSYHVRLTGPLMEPGVRGEKKTIPAAEKGPVPSKKIRRKLPPKEVVKAPPPGAVKPPPKADMTLESTDRVSREIRRLRAISSLARKKGDEGRREIEVVKKAAPGKGTKGAGMPGQGAHMGSSSYYAQITEKIWKQWMYPGAESTGLETVVSIRIDREGRIVSREVEKSSGNNLFDRSALKALLKASPLPPPPVELEVGVRFYL